MQGWRMLAPSALALLALLAAADGREIGKQQQFVNGTNLIESFLAAINATRPGLPSRNWAPVKSEMQDQALRSGTVYNLPDSSRFTFGNAVTGYLGLSQYYLYTRLLEQYIRNVIANDINYIATEYLTFEESPDYGVKYFLVWATWDEAVAACTADGGSLYTFGHSVELDGIMSIFYPALLPWINLQKTDVEGGTEKSCGFLKSDYNGLTVQFDLCTNRHNYICEKPLEDRLRKEGKVSGKEITKDFWTSIRKPVQSAPRVRNPMFGKALSEAALPVDSALDKSRTGAVYSLPASSRYSVTGVGAGGLDFYYNFISLIEEYAFLIASQDITYNQLDYLTFLESPDQSVKYFLTKATYDDAADACVDDNAILYAGDHSLDLDYKMAAFYPLLTPWLALRKPGVDGGEDRCAYLRAEIYGSSIHWDDCDEPHYFICQRGPPPPGGGPPEGEGPDGEGPDGEGPDGEGPDGEGPDGEGPDGEGPPEGGPPEEGPKPPPGGGGGGGGGGHHHGHHHGNTDIFIKIDIVIDALNKLTQSINVASATSIRSELRRKPLALMDKIFLLKDKKDTIEAQWKKLPEADKMILSEKLDHFAENMNKAASDRTVMTKYFSETVGKRQLITVQLEEMILLLKPFF